MLARRFDSRPNSSNPSKRFLMIFFYLDTVASTITAVLSNVLLAANGSAVRGVTHRRLILSTT
jgi:hypothetical protein